MTDRRDAALQGLEGGVVIEHRVLLAKRPNVAKDMYVDERDQPVKLQKSVLERRGRQENLVPLSECPLQRVRDDVRRPVDVAEAVGFVDHHEVPRHGGNIGFLASCELVRADHDRAIGEWVLSTLFTPKIE